AIVSTKEGRFSTEALVIKSMIPNGIVCEHSTLEDIILFLVRGEG
ncbi:MAG: ABC transporter ATP-binding protein, partial [Clostridiales bacterium]|nr:ABC transporter ATP-binding protein [Clostridiales bacterium]